MGRVLVSKAFTEEELKIVLDPSIILSKDLKSKLPRLKKVDYANQLRIKNGINPVKTNNVDHNYFSIPNLENSYWAGFISAAGCVYEQGIYKSVKISLAIKDLEHLNKFCEMTGANIPTFGESSYYQKVNKYASVSVRSKQWAIDLKENFNITCRKTKTNKPPTLSYENSLAFIAGYIDGDGSYSWNIKQNSPTLSILGTKEVLEWIQSVVGLSAKITYSKGCYYTNYISNKAIYFRSRYIDLPIPFLKRKINNWEYVFGGELEMKTSSRSYYEI